MGCNQIQIDNYNKVNTFRFIIVVCKILEIVYKFRYNFNNVVVYVDKSIKQQDFQVKDISYKEVETLEEIQFNIKMCKTIKVNVYLINNIKYSDKIVLGY